VRYGMNEAITRRARAAIERDRERDGGARIKK
jgi:hypothetical protein